MNHYSKRQEEEPLVFTGRKIRSAVEDSSLVSLQEPALPQREAGGTPHQSHSVTASPQGEAKLYSIIMEQINESSNYPVIGVFGDSDYEVTHSVMRKLSTNPDLCYGFCGITGPESVYATIERDAQTFIYDIDNHLPYLIPRIQQALRNNFSVVTIEILTYNIKLLARELFSAPTEDSLFIKPSTPDIENCMRDVARMMMKSYTDLLEILNFKRIVFLKYSKNSHNLNAEILDKLYSIAGSRYIIVLYSDDKYEFVPVSAIRDGRTKYFEEKNLIELY